MITNTCYPLKQQQRYLHSQIDTISKKRIRSSSSITRDEPQLKKRRSDEIVMVDTVTKRKDPQGYEKIDKDCWTLILDAVVVTCESLPLDTFDRDSRFPVLSNLSLVSKFFMNFTKIFYWDELVNQKPCLYLWHKLSVPVGSFSQSNKNGRLLKVFKIDKTINNREYDNLGNYHFIQFNSETTVTTAIPGPIIRNVHQTISSSSSMTFDITFTKAPHYFCNTCRNVVQCAHCVHKKDYPFTTSKDLEYINRHGNTTKDRRYKKHPNKIHMICPQCESNNVVKRYLSSKVLNKFVYT